MKTNELVHITLQKIEQEQVTFYSKWNPEGIFNHITCDTRPVLYTFSYCNETWQGEVISIEEENDIQEEKNKTAFMEWLRNKGKENRIPLTFSILQSLTYDERYLLVKQVECSGRMGEWSISVTCEDDRKDNRILVDFVVRENKLVICSYDSKKEMLQDEEIMNISDFVTHIQKQLQFVLREYEWIYDGNFILDSKQYQQNISRLGTTDFQEEMKELMQKSLLFAGNDEMRFELWESNEADYFLLLKREDGRLLCEQMKKMNFGDYKTNEKGDYFFSFVFPKQPISLFGFYQNIEKNLKRKGFSCEIFETEKTLEYV